MGIIQWKIYGTFTVKLWTIYGKIIGKSWIIFWKCMCNLRETYGTDMEHEWDSMGISWKNHGNSWENHVICGDYHADFTSKHRDIAVISYHLLFFLNSELEAIARLYSSMIYLAIKVWFFKEWTIDLFSNQSFQAQPDQKLHLQPWDSDSFCLGTWGTESDAAGSFLSFCDGKGLYLIVNGCMYIYISLYMCV